MPKAARFHLNVKQLHATPQKHRKDHCTTAKPNKSGCVFTYARVLLETRPRLLCCRQSSQLHPRVEHLVRGLSGNTSLLSSRLSTLMAICWQTSQRSNLLQAHQHRGPVIVIRVQQTVISAALCVMSCRALGHAI